MLCENCTKKTSTYSYEFQNSIYGIVPYGKKYNPLTMKNRDFSQAESWILLLMWGICPFNIIGIPIAFTYLACTMPIIQKKVERHPFILAFENDSVDDFIKYCKMYNYYIESNIDTRHNFLLKAVRHDAISIFKWVIENHQIDIHWEFDSIVKEVHGKIKEYLLERWTITQEELNYAATYKIDLTQKCNYCGVKDTHAIACLNK